MQDVEQRFAAARIQGFDVFPDKLFGGSFGNNFFKLRQKQDGLFAAYP
jgi:hypothetical protein